MHDETKCGCFPVCLIGIGIPRPARHLALLGDRDQASAAHFLWIASSNTRAKVESSRSFFLNKTRDFFRGICPMERSLHAKIALHAGAGQSIDANNFIPLPDLRGPTGTNTSLFSGFKATLPTGRRPGSEPELQLEMAAGSWFQ